MLRTLLTALVLSMSIPAANKTQQIRNTRIVFDQFTLYIRKAEKSRQKVRQTKNYPHIPSNSFLYFAVIFLQFLHEACPLARFLFYSKYTEIL